MIQPTIITWVLLIFGFITCMPLLYVQLFMLFDPHSKKTRDLVIGKEKDWHDKTHLQSAIGGAWADWIVFVPLLVVGAIGVILGTEWGYAVYATAGAIMLYINTILWFQEKEYVYLAQGPLVYYTYYWGNFVYWGVAAIIYSVLRLSGMTL